MCIEIVLNTHYLKELILIMAAGLHLSWILGIQQNNFLPNGLVDLPIDNVFQNATNNRSTHDCSMKLWSIELPVY